MKVCRENLPKISAASLGNYSAGTGVNHIGRARVVISSRVFFSLSPSPRSTSESARRSPWSPIEQFNSTGDASLRRQLTTILPAVAICLRTHRSQARAQDKISRDASLAEPGRMGQDTHRCVEIAEYTRPIRGQKRYWDVWTRSHHHEMNRERTSDRLLLLAISLRKTLLRARVREILPVISSSPSGAGVRNVYRLAINDNRIKANWARERR